MKKILIINDIASVNKLLAHSLESEGFYVDTALTGAEGVSQAKEVSYDMILLDYHLPDIDGGQVCRTIKSEAHLRDTPVYFISALDKETLEKVITDTGAQGYMDVAIDVESLAAQIKQAIGE